MSKYPTLIIGLTLTVFSSYQLGRMQTQDEIIEEDITHHKILIIKNKSYTCKVFRDGYKKNNKSKE